LNSRNQWPPLSEVDTDDRGIFIETPRCDVMRTKIGLFIPCYVDQLFPQVARAMVTVLEKCGVACHFDSRQTCCGQPAFNSGYHDEARRVAEHFVTVFDQYETIVAPGGSCVSMVRNHFAQVLGRDEPVTHRVFELCEFLTDHLCVEDLGATLSGRAAVHIPCHMLRELGGGRAVRSLLSRVRGLEIVDLPSDTWCCGFGGMFSVKYPELSAAMALQKIRQVADLGLDYILSPESSCLMQLDGVLRREGFKMRALHVAQVLAGQTFA
jgi:L-lactate dehydrogenase complex protein LldE